MWPPTPWSAGTATLRSWLTFKAHQQQFERENEHHPRQSCWCRGCVSLSAGSARAHSIDLVWKRASDGAISPPGARLEDLDASWNNATIYTSRVWGTFRALTTTDEFLGAIDQTENVTSRLRRPSSRASATRHSIRTCGNLSACSATLAISILVSLLLAVFLITLAFSCNLTTSLVMLALLV
jgi:hypothetical protein